MAQVKAKEALVERGYSVCDDFINQFRAGHLARQPGFDEEATLEVLSLSFAGLHHRVTLLSSFPLHGAQAVITGTLSKIREDAGQLCIRSLPWFNAPLIMALCGSKGARDKRERERDRGGS
jgi:DNA-directed RNA polymerase III subunit RPC1